MFARRTGWRLAENRYSSALRAALEGGAKLIDLTASNPTQCQFSFDSARILSALAHTESLNYDPDPQGLLLARNAVVDYYQTKPLAKEMKLSPEQNLNYSELEKIAYVVLIASRKLKHYFLAYKIIVPSSYPLQEIFLNKEQVG